MTLTLNRIIRTNTNTMGTLFVNGEFECFTLEDLPHTPKIYGKTRIPAGDYKITLRTVGTTHNRYAKRFPDFHKGMLWIRDVPNFEYILIHIGNVANDTDGCILVGQGHNNDYTKLVNSTLAYTNLYKKIINEKNLNIIIKDELKVED